MAHILIIGGTGVGKSSTINALSNKTMAKVGFSAEPKTQRLMGYRVRDYVLWDSPGLGEGVNEDIRHIRSINELIAHHRGHKIQHLLLIVEANKRDFGTVYKVIDEIAKPQFSQQVAVVMNQADQAMKGRGWNANMNEPDPELLAYLNEQAKSVRQRIIENTGISISTPLFYSASTGYGVSSLNDYLVKLSRECKKMGHA